MEAVPLSKYEDALYRAIWGIALGNEALRRSKRTAPPEWRPGNPLIQTLAAQLDDLRRIGEPLPSPNEMAGDVQREREEVVPQEIVATEERANDTKTVLSSDEPEAKAFAVPSAATMRGQHSWTLAQ